MGTSQPDLLRPGAYVTKRFLRWCYLAVCLLAAVGIALMCLGAVATPLAGWGALVVFAAGLWTLVAAVLPASMLLLGALIFRLRYRQWYFGGGVDGVD